MDLLARSMQSNSSERSLSTAMGTCSCKSETNRIKRFYQSRFKGSADNLVIAFRKLVDGTDLGIFDNVSGSKSTAHCVACRPTLSQAEAGILALSYAESLENPEPLINHDCDRIAWNDSAIPRNAPLVKRHRVIRGESSVITRTGKTMTSTRNDMIPTRTCEAEEE